MASFQELVHMIQNPAYKPPSPTQAPAQSNPSLPKGPSLPAPKASASISAPRMRNTASLSSLKKGVPGATYKPFFTPTVTEKEASAMPLPIEPPDDEE